jgi:hypothetical protein
MVRSHIRTCASAVVAIGLTAGSTEASADVTVPPVVTAESAAVLADSIDAEVRQWSSPASGGYQWDGKTTAAAVGDHYDVTLPSLRLIGEHARFDIGVIKLGLTPETDGSVDVAAVLPSQITTLGADGQPDGHVVIGSQHFSGHWLPSLGTFVKVDGAYGDLQASSPKDSSRFTVGTLTFKVDLTQTPTGRWTGPSAFGINKVDVFDEHGAQLAHFGDLTLSTMVSDLDLKQALASDVNGKANNAGETKVAKEEVAKEDDAKSEDAKSGKDEDEDAKDEEGKTGNEVAAKDEDAKAGKDVTAKVKAKAEAENTDKKTLEEFRSLLQHLTATHEALTSLSAKLELKDVAVTASDVGPVTFDHVEVEGGVKHDGEMSTISLGYNHDGLKLTSPSVPPGLLPQKADVSVDLSSLPAVKLASILLRANEAKASGDDKGAEAASRDLLVSLYQPGVQLNIKSLHIDTPMAAVKLNGDARLDGTAKQGAVVSIDMALRGVDALVKETQPAPGAKPDEEAQNLAAILTMLQVMGAPGKDESGRDVRDYKLRMGTDGKILLNGTDLSAMLPSNQPQGGAPPAAGH